MNIKQNFHEQLKIKDLAYLNELGAEIVEFYPKNDCLEGKLYVTGNYHSSKTDLDKLISQNIPFNIVLDDNNFSLDDIDCTKFDYKVIEGLGIELEYEISANLTIDEENVKEKTDEKRKATELIELKEEIKPLENEEVEKPIDENETIKNEITLDIDKKLVSKLEVVDDNDPSEDLVIRSLENNSSIFKVVYYNTDQELEQICNDNDISIDRVFKENKTNDFNKYHRVIIKNGK